MQTQQTQGGIGSLLDGNILDTCAPHHGASLAQTRARLGFRFLAAPIAAV